VRGKILASPGKTNPRGDKKEIEKKEKKNSAKFAEAKEEK
jgi:hypothetical protein